MMNSLRHAVLWLGLLATPGLAEDGAIAEPGPPPRVRSVIIYGNAPCPKGHGDEIVVCGRESADDLYRVPKRFRGKNAIPAQQSWANTAAALDEVGRVGTPDSCSPVGSGGQTGCTRAFLRQAREERREAEREAAQIP